jgi:hypothetical protein
MTKVTSPLHWAGCDEAVNVLHSPGLVNFQTNIAESLDHPVKHHRKSSDYIFNDRFTNTVNNHRKHVNCCISKMGLFDENRLMTHCQQYGPTSMNDRHFPDRILPPAGWDRPEPSWFDLCWCICMAIAEHSQLIHLSIDNVPVPPQPEDTPDEETIDHQKPDPTCIPDPTKTQTHRHVVGVEYVAGRAYSKATGLYNKHRKYSNPWHPVQSAPDYRQAQSFNQQPKTCIDQYLRHGLDNLNIKSFQSGDTLQTLLSRLDFELGNDSWIEDNSHIFGILYYRDIFTCIQLLLAHLPVQVHLDFKLVRIAVLNSRRIYS